MEATVTYRSCAKINLYLGVLNRRRDGYHNIETVFQTVSLADRIEFFERPEGVTLECSAPGLDRGGVVAGGEDDHRARGAAVPGFLRGVVDGGILGGGAAGQGREEHDHDQEDSSIHRRPPPAAP